MLPVHDHNARASTQITAAMDMAMDLGSCETNASGWHRGVLLGKPSPVFLPRFAA